jgi:L-threonine-O-3-phosphate decarboxylase
MLEHGGGVRRIAAVTGTAPEDWLDLSSGINPESWPLREIPLSCWQRLPEDEDGLIEVAGTYYGTSALLPVAGTQAAIQLLPRLRPACRVGVVGPTYAEHAHVWQQNGHGVRSVDGATLARELDAFDVVVVVNPNNPTGEYHPPERLNAWHPALRARGGWLIVDEAFVDPTPTRSLVAQAPQPGLIVLRSFGKFFGLPGARLGFVAAHPDLLQALRELAGPWSVNGPARAVARGALSDVAWQEDMRVRVAQESHSLAELLRVHGLAPRGGTPLFQWVQTDRARAVYQHLLEQRVLVRLFERPLGLRFGLPGQTQQWERLRAALAGISCELAAESGLRPAGVAPCKGETTDLF